LREYEGKILIIIKIMLILKIKTPAKALFKIKISNKFNEKKKVAIFFILNKNIPNI